MKAVEKESNISQGKQHKQEAQASLLPVRETENANAHSQKAGAPPKAASNDGQDNVVSTGGIPAVHGSQPAYAQGSALMYAQLQASLEQTGDLNHPDTKKKEMDYKMTLSISDLRDYHEMKSNGTAAAAEATQKGGTPKSTAETPATVKVPEVKVPEVTSEAKTPEVKAPEVKAPEVTPEAKTPEVITPEVKAPEVTPEAKTPEVITPEVKAPEVTSEAKTPEVKAPEAKTPEVTPEAKIPEVKTLEAKTSEAKTPETKTSGAKSPEGKIPDAKAQNTDAVVPSTQAPSTDKPEVAAVAKTSKEAIQQPTDAKIAEENQEVPAVDAPLAASANPGFIAVQAQIGTTAKSQQQHEKASKSSHDAQAAAPSPANERQSKAQAGKVNEMDAQEAGTFKTDDFTTQLLARLDKLDLPKDEEAADNFDKNNNIKEVNDKAVGDVKKEKNAASGAIASATAKAPNTAGQPVRVTAKMPTANPGKAPARISVENAMPSKRDAAGVEKPIQEQTAAIDNEMQANGVTDNMLANSNEPTYINALGEKNKAKASSQEGTAQFRENESKQLKKTQAESQNQVASQVGAMHTARKGGLDKVHGNQTQTAGKDTEKRKEIADRINGIYLASKKDVDGILSSLDAVVAQKFMTGSRVAKAVFENHVAVKMAAYKKKRYGDSFFSWKNLRRVKDAFKGLPKEVNEFFVSGRQAYINAMHRYIIEIGQYVSAQLNAAKAKIAAGKKAVQDYVNTLSPSLKKLGQAAIVDIQGKFSALEDSVDKKKEALLDALTKKYEENLAGIDERIKQLKTLNSGLISLAMNALTGIFQFIIEVKNTLMSLLAKVVEVVVAIISDPIGFFKNLIAGVGLGFSNFTANIWTHLKNGFFSWLTGSMQGVNLTMPEDVFSLKGIFSISMQVLGLTWEGIREIGAKVVGEPLMKILETGVEIVQIVRKDGIAGLWEFLKDQFQDLKETVIDAIMDIIQNQVIQAGIKWILGLLSPVGAFVKAIMAIIDVVKFFIQRAAQIMELVKAFTESVAAIASGKIGAVASAIENALAKAVPVLIGLLASILGISGLADKVLGVIKKIRARITAGITKFWNFVKEKGAKLLAKVGIGDKKDKKKVDDKHVNNMDSGIAPEPFTMNGKGHTLTFEKGKIYMASAKDELDNKLGRSIKYTKEHSGSEELHGNADQIGNELQSLRLQNKKAEEDLSLTKGLSDSDPQKAQKVKAAQHSLDALSAKIAAFGSKYKLIDLAGEYETKEVGDKGLKVGLHQLKGPGRQSHHVPEKQLKIALMSLYSKVGQELASQNSYEDLGKKFTDRAAALDSKFDGNGKGLPAILITEKTHKNGSEKGVHNEGLQEEALAQMRKTVGAEGGYRTIIYDNGNDRLVASFRKQHYEGLVKVVYDLVSSGKDKAQIIKDNGNDFIVKSTEHQANGTGLIADNIKEFITKFGGETADERQKEKTQLKVLKDINETAEQTFKQSLGSSLDVLKSAMEVNKDEEGDDTARNDALEKVKELSKNIWGTHVYKAIK